MTKEQVIEYLQVSKLRPTMYYLTNGECDATIWAFLIVFGHMYGPNYYSNNAGAEVRGVSVLDGLYKTDRLAFTPEWINRAIDQAIMVLEGK